eukprot:13180844-Alexandrium_andersonii.AAC.1
MAQPDRVAHYMAFHTAHTSHMPQVGCRMGRVGPSVTRASPSVKLCFPDAPAFVAKLALSRRAPSCHSLAR